jgi:hypothetical protein
VLESQLDYYANSEQFAFAQKEQEDAKRWADLLQALWPETPARKAAKGPYHSPLLLRTLWERYLPLFVTGAGGRDAGTDLVVVGNPLVLPAQPKAGQPVEIRVTIQNKGTSAITRPFWVDLYVDLKNSAVLPQVNSPWPDISPYGVAWRVYTLAAGESLTLTTNSPNDPNDPGGRYSSFSNFPSSGNHVLYVLLDSYADGSAEGAVLEDTESNNLNGPTEVTVLGNTTADTSMPAVVLDQRPSK